MKKKINNTVGEMQTRCIGLRDYHLTLLYVAFFVINKYIQLHINSSRIIRQLFSLPGRPF